jgi:phosphatidate cytidylyltransferase
METHTPSTKRANFCARSITAIILAPIVLWLVYIGGPAYKALVLVMAILMAFEWNDITSNQPDERAQLIWKLVGIAYILLPTISLLWLRDHHKGQAIVFWLLATVWATDIAAYFVGSIIGGWKIYPAISPNKTWSGLAGGVIAAAFVGYITAKLSNSNKPDFLIMLSVVLGVYGQIGDFVESWIKRKFGVKDSGKMLPGHGGILDRVDSLVPVAPKVVFVVLFDKWGIF